MFAKEYIALIAGLHEYNLDSDSKKLDLPSMLEEIFDELTSSDARLVRQLYGFYDCENIVSAYNKSSRFNSMGLLTAEDIEQLLSGVEVDEGLLGREQRGVIERFVSKGNEPSQLSDLGFSRELYAAYYNDCEASSNRLLREWSRSERNLRNVIAALIARNTGRAIDGVVVGDGDVVDQINRSSAADFALRGELTYIDSLIATMGDSSNMVEQERKIDMIRWDIVEELSQMEYFTMDALLAYLIKVNMIVRWRSLNPQIGREMFDKLVSELTENRG